MRIELDVFGDKQVAREILRIGEHAEDCSPAFRGLADYFRDLEQEQFSSEGGSGSGGWPPLAPATVAAKGHDTILYHTGALRDSLTEAGDEHHTEEVSRDELVFGTTVPYAKFHQRGTSRMPRRRPVELSERERRETVRRVQQWIMTRRVAP